MPNNLDRYMSRLNERLMSCAQRALDEMNYLLDDMNNIAEQHPEREDITGYHGTSKDIASKIIEKKYFMISNGDKEWLGRGIYFYTNYEDALEWSKLKYDTAFSVLHTIIEINQEEFIDFDTEEGKEIFECFKSLFNKHGIAI